jgi:hypothetical protein
MCKKMYQYFLIQFWPQLYYYQERVSVYLHLSVNILNKQNLWFTTHTSSPIIVTHYFYLWAPGIIIVSCNFSAPKSQDIMVCVPGMLNDEAFQWNHHTMAKTCRESFRMIDRCRSTNRIKMLDLIPELVSLPRLFFVTC